MNTKLVVALVTVGVLAVTVVGLVSAQIVSSTPGPNGTSSNGVSTGSFFGWMARCLGFRGTSYSGNQPENIAVTDPNTATTTTIQGYHGDGGCRMMRSFYP